MVKIKNKKALVENTRSKNDKQARAFALDALEASLNAADPVEVVKSLVKIRGNSLQIGKCKFSLSQFKHIYVVGGGKASGKMAEALESILEDHISNGAINVPYNSGPYKTCRIEIKEASHPLPDNAGMKGAKRILDLAHQAGESDLVICLISGGGSSLMPVPRGNITLIEKQQVTGALLKSGATINEINTVRKHISDFKGGWLAKNAYPATIINLILSDVIGDPLDFIASGPTVPDSTTFTDSVEILKRYHLWENLPNSVKIVLIDGQKGVIPETPKKGENVFRKVHNIVAGNNRLATSASCNRLKKAGLPSLLLTSSLEGEARHIGTMLASIANELRISGNPLPTPCGIIAGGETTVTVIGKGKGGRNQEIALSAALGMAGRDGVVIASLSTDGIDGPTDASGAIVDGNTINRSQNLEVDAESSLANNDSYNFFLSLNDLIFTGLTGTNVNDVSIIVAI
ncbi:MAG: glycerate kinase [Candidatus Bathyarchaeota archaeon]|nr:MAG: glycerate kinase [Candidatus Bathyarchaeota archaeon]